MDDRPFAAQLRRMLGVDLEELAGASIAGELPIPNDVINRLIAQRLAASQGPIAGVRVDARDHDTLDIELSMRGSHLLPVIRIMARIDRQPDLPRAWILELQWSVPGMGPLALFAAPALAWLKALPPGIRAEGDRLAIDIAEVLRSQGLGELLRYLTKLQVHARAGAVVAQFELRVRQGH